MNPGTEMAPGTNFFLPRDTTLRARGKIVGQVFSKFSIRGYLLSGRHAQEMALGCVDEAKLLSHFAVSGYFYLYCFDNDSCGKSDK
jgi:hypothetical protein